MSVYIVVWCNGNTTDFGSVFQGSNPCATTWSYSLMEKHFATDKKSWGSSPYRTSRLRYSSGGRALDSYPSCRWFKSTYRNKHGGRSLVGRALACGASCRGFESHRSHNRRVA
jgi:hypothetical protein